MLVLKRRFGESIVIDGEITIKIERYKGGQVKLLIDAPNTISVDRLEVHEERKDESARFDRKF